MDQRRTMYNLVEDVYFIYLNTYYVAVNVIEFYRRHQNLHFTDTKANREQSDLTKITQKGPSASA